MTMWAAVFMAACGGSKAPPAAATREAPAAVATPAHANPMPGGYFDQAVDTDEAKKRAAQAIELLRISQKDPSIALVKIKTFSQQVVAGMNYEFALDVTTAAGPRTVRVTMFQALNDGPRSISSASGF